MIIPDRWNLAEIMDADNYELSEKEYQKLGGATNIDGKKEILEKACEYLFL